MTVLTSSRPSAGLHVFNNASGAAAVRHCGWYAIALSMRADGGRYDGLKALEVLSTTRILLPAAQHNTAQHSTAHRHARPHAARHHRQKRNGGGGAWRAEEGGGGRRTDRRRCIWRRRGSCSGRATGGGGCVCAARAASRGAAAGAASTAPPAPPTQTPHPTPRTPHATRRTPHAVCSLSQRPRRSIRVWFFVSRGMRVCRSQRARVSVGSELRASASCIVYGHAVIFVTSSPHLRHIFVILAFLSQHHSETNLVDRAENRHVGSFPRAAHNTHISFRAVFSATRRV